jgi:2-dehydropantoate 2-reductase
MRHTKGDDMKTLIVGMGNIGVIHGWALSESAADITHVVRKASLGKYSGGVEMDVLDMRGDLPRSYRTSYRPKVIDAVAPGQGYELVIVATNHFQAASAVCQYRDLVPEADFLMFTANWEGPGEIDALLPRSRYLWGFSVSSGGRGADGAIYANIQKQYRIGELDGSRTPRLERITTMFGSAGLTADIKTNIIEWLWVHHAIDAGAIGTALYIGGFPGKDSGLEVWVLMVRAVKDALAVLQKRGVDVRAYADAKPFLQPDDEEAAKVFRQMISSWPHYERSRKHSHLDTSPVEMKRFYLDVLATGERLGVPMPYLASLKDKICRDG